MESMCSESDSQYDSAESERPLDAAQLIQNARGLKRSPRRRRQPQQQHQHQKQPQKEAVLPLLGHRHRNGTPRNRSLSPNLSRSADRVLFPKAKSMPNTSSSLRSSPEFQAGILSSSASLPLLDTGTASPRLSGSPVRVDSRKNQTVVRRFISSGGAADVYEASKDGKVIAVKIYHQYYNQNCAERDSICALLRALVAMPSHDNVLAVTNFYFENSARLVVEMELMHTSLRQLIQLRRDQFYQSRYAEPLAVLEFAPFDREEVLHLFLQIVRGLRHLHETSFKPKGGHGRIDAVWHRDLKSDNILCVEQLATLPDLLHGQDLGLTKHKRPCGSCLDWVVKIADFDESKLVYGQSMSNGGATSSFLKKIRRPSSSSSSLAARTERLTANVGTLQYRAPEILCGTLVDSDVDYNEKVDIWSAGMILFELLTMELPYAREKYEWYELSEQIRNVGRPELPRGYLQQAEWRPVRTLFYLCTELDPDLRPAAAELVTLAETISQ